MNVAQTRTEILRLIEQLRAGGSLPAELPPPRTRRWPGSDRRQRKSVDIQRLEARIADLYGRLDQRIGALERRFDGDSPQATPGKIPPFVLGGQLREGLLPDIVQLITGNVMSGVLVVSGELGEVEVYFIEGEIFDAKMDEDTKGEAAFFAALAMEKGGFQFRESDKLPSQRKIKAKTQFLILEGLRQIDESRQ